MFRTVLITGAFLLPLASVAAPAFAEGNQGCTSAPRASWLSEDDAKAKVTQAGYQVRDLKTEGSCYEIYATKDGARVQLVMNPSSGEIMGNEEGEN